MTIKSRIEKLEATKTDGPSPLTMILWKARRLNDSSLPEVPVTYTNHDYETLLAKVRHGQS